MNIGIFGLGYVGAVSAGCPAHAGHQVIGIDPAETKVDLINRGRTPIIEQEIRRIICNAVSERRLRATTEHGILPTEFFLKLHK